MPDLLAAIPILFAQNAPEANPGGDGGDSLVRMLPFVVAIGLWGYFLLFRPQQQQEKKRRQMLVALKKNDKVLTSAGIYGVVISVDSDQDRVVLRVDDDRGVKIAFSKGSITRVVDVSSDKSADKPAAVSEL